MVYFQFICDILDNFIRAILFWDHVHAGFNILNTSIFGFFIFETLTIQGPIFWILQHLDFSISKTMSLRWLNILNTCPCRSQYFENFPLYLKCCPRPNLNLIKVSATRPFGSDLSLLNNQIYISKKSQVLNKIQILKEITIIPTIHLQLNWSLDLASILFLSWVFLSLWRLLCSCSIPQMFPHQGGWVAVMQRGHLWLFPETDIDQIDSIFSTGSLAFPLKSSSGRRCCS